MYVTTYYIQHSHTCMRDSNILYEEHALRQRCELKLRLSPAYVKERDLHLVNVHRYTIVM